MTEQKVTKGRNYPVLLIIGSILILVLITFALQNAQAVDLEFFKLKGQVTKSLLIFGCIFGGLLVGILFSLPATLKWRRSSKRIQKELKSTQAELEKSRLKAKDTAESQKPQTIKKPRQGEV